MGISHVIVWAGGTFMGAVAGVYLCHKWDAARKARRFQRWVADRISK